MNTTTPLNLSPDMTLLQWIDIPAGQATLEKGWDGTIYSPQKGKTYQVEPFSISKYPVTVGQFKVFISDDGYRNDQWWTGLAQRIINPEEMTGSTPTHPRDMVSWYEAIAFCRWLSDKLGENITLPTEMQWQWAAQFDDGREYPWGDSFDTNRCNTFESGIRQTTPVDRYQSGTNSLGVMDMSGNVWEWCLNEHYNPANCTTTGEGVRVLRGGSWFNDSYNARTTYRSGFRPVNQDDNIGFRLVRIH